MKHLSIQQIAPFNLYLVGNNLDLLFGDVQLNLQILIPKLTCARIPKGTKNAKKNKYFFI